MKSALCLLLPLSFALGASACTADPTAIRPQDFDTRKLQLTARVENVDGMVRGLATLRNASSRSARVSVVLFPCAVHLELLAPSGALLWDQGQHMPPTPGGCKWLPSDVTLAPRDSSLIVSNLVAETALRSDLGSGSFAARVEVIFARFVSLTGSAGAQTTQVDSVVLIPAGSVTIH
jgi:hypothetical protein